MLTPRKSDLPTGTVTFLFTDIEGSTRRWERHPQVMKAAVERHDAILHRAVEGNGGYVFRTEGDAFRAAFPTASRALLAALDAQRALYAEPWSKEVGPIQVRMAVHTGEAEVREGDYVGASLNRMGRLLSVAHGGQTLLSLPTEQLVRDHLPAGAVLQDMGEHRLKDLILPEHIFQLVVPDIPAEFPPLNTLDVRPNNLPSQRSPLVGREAELAIVQRLLLRDDVGLLTLTGPGGIGKTRLALQVAADLIDAFQDGVIFISLAHITDPTLVAPAIAQALGVKQVAVQEMVDALGEYLSDKQLLLVLDNFEQVVSAGPSIVKMLASAPRLKALVTSREVLRVRDEQEFAVPPLGVPDPSFFSGQALNSMPSLEKLSQYEAVALFIQRARQVQPDFEVTNENAPAVAEICYRLDGLPLAIELAAARIRLLPPQAMLTRLASTPRSAVTLLTTGARDLPVRQQTLRSTIQWSYDLLQPGEQMLFRRMSVFVGGGTLEAIEAVCNADGTLKLDVLDGVGSLVDKSLVRQETGSTTGGLADMAGAVRTEREPRFGMLETIREYGRELLQSAETAGGEELYQQHAKYYMTLAEQGREGVQGPQQEVWLDRLEAEHDNLQAAMKWAIEQGDAQTALCLGGALWIFRGFRTYPNEGYQWLRKALGLPGGEVRNRARAVALTGASLMSGNEFDVASYRAYIEESISIFRELGPEERGELGIALLMYGIGLGLSGEHEAARAAAEEGISLLRQAGNKWGLSLGLYMRGSTGAAEGDMAAAREAYEESIDLSREVGNTWVLAQVLNALGDISRLMGDYTRAKEVYEESLTLMRRLNAKTDIPASLHNLGHVALAQGRVEDAKKLFVEALRLQISYKDRVGIVECLAGLAGVAGAEKHPERAARLFGAAETLREGLGAQVWPVERADYERNLASARRQLGPEPAKEAAWEKACQAGRIMTMEQAIAYALGDLDESRGPASDQQP